MTFWQAYRALVIDTGKAIAFVAITFGYGLFIAYLLAEQGTAQAVAALAGVVVAAIGMGAWHMSHWK